MKRRAIFLATLGFLLGVTAAPSTAQSLADLARAQREKQDKEGKKPAKVYGTDDVLALKAKAHKPGSPLTVESEDGRSVQVAPDKTTDLIYMGTWCPYSKQLKNMLNDPRTRPYLANRKLIFLFDHNEWPTVVSKVIKGAKGGNYSEDDVATELAQLMKKSGSPRVFDPTFLGNLPGQFYFCLQPDEVEGFPTILSLNGYSNTLEWLVNERNMPEELAHKVSGDYDPDKQDSSEK